MFYFNFQIEHFNLWIRLTIFDDFYDCLEISEFWRDHLVEMIFFSRFWSKTIPAVISWIWFFFAKTQDKNLSKLPADVSRGQSRRSCWKFTILRLNQNDQLRREKDLSTEIKRSLDFETLWSFRWKLTIIELEVYDQRFC